MSREEALQGDRGSPSCLDLPGPFLLESGKALPQVRVAYRTWGTLNADGTNAVLVSPARTASADADLWWGGLFGPGGRSIRSGTSSCAATSWGAVTARPRPRLDAAGGWPAVRLGFSGGDWCATWSTCRPRCSNPSECGGSGWCWADRSAACRCSNGRRSTRRGSRRSLPLPFPGRRSARRIGLSEAQRQAICADPLRARHGPGHRPVHLPEPGLLRGALRPAP